MYKKIDIDRSATVRENVLPYRVLKLKYIENCLRVDYASELILILYWYYTKNTSIILSSIILGR